MRAAIIENGTVANIIAIDDGYQGAAVRTRDLPVQIGDSYDGTDFWREGERVTEQTGLQAESEAITAEYIAALEALGVEVESNETN